MELTGLDKFSDTSHWPPGRLTFFDLPFKVRYRIYEFVRLVQTMPINLNFKCIRPSNVYMRGGVPESDQQFQNRKYLETADYACGSIPWGLLCVSREASHIFYSRNKFMICQSWPGGFRALQNLTAESISALTTVSIRINSCPGCFPPDKICRWKAGFRDRPLKAINSPQNKKILADWTSLCNRLAQHVQHRRLRLSFVCDTEDVETAKAFVAPLKAFPTVSQCALRLSQTPNPDLQCLVGDTVNQLTTDFSGLASFPFLALPNELQSRVLAHTDLVAPSAIEWVLKDGYVMHNKDGCGICFGVRQSCCKRLYQMPFSSRCSCWKFPKELLRAVSRNVREEAFHIFYLSNDIILPYEDIPGTPRLNIAWFLSSVSRDSRKHLRSLVFVLPNAESLDPQITVDLTTAANILCADPPSNLTLTVVVSSMMHYYFDRATSRFRFRPADSAPSSDERWIFYQQLFQPLHLLQGILKNCFVYLPHVHHSEEVETREAYEKVIERNIMGDDGYDSACHGKRNNPVYGAGSLRW